MRCTGEKKVRSSRVWRLTAWTTLEAARGIPRAICACTHVDAHVPDQVAEVIGQARSSPSTTCCASYIVDRAAVARRVVFSDSFLVGKVACLREDRTYVSEEENDGAGCRGEGTLRPHFTDWLTSRH